MALLRVVYEQRKQNAIRCSSCFINDYEKGNVSSIKFSLDATLVNEKLKELELKNEKLMAREEIYKSIIKKQAEVLEHYKHDFDHDPSEDEIKRDYDCGCCSVGAAGARAFVVLKEVSKILEEIEGEK